MDKDYRDMLDGLIEEYNALIARKNNGEDVEAELDKAKRLIFDTMFYGHEWPRIKKMQQGKYGD